MNSALIFGIGTVVFIAVATATFIWGYMQFDALRISDDRVVALADATLRTEAAVPEISVAPVALIPVAFTAQPQSTPPRVE